MGQYGHQLRGLSRRGGALVRFLVRVGEGAQAAQHVLRAVRTRPGFDFWPDALSYADVDLDAVVGHRQATDAYLVDLVKQRPPARLATLDGAARAELTGADPAVAELTGPGRAGGVSMRAHPG